MLTELTGLSAAIDLFQAQSFPGDVSQAVWFAYDPATKKVYALEASQIVFGGQPDSCFPEVLEVTTELHIPSLAGKKILLAGRNAFTGSVPVNSTDPDFFPTGNQLKWNKDTCILSTPADWPFIPLDQNIAIMYV